MTALDRGSLLRASERLRRQGVDGILVIAPLVEAVRALPDLRGDVPVVALEAGPQEGVPVVAVDQEAGARVATQHLLDLGHRTVAHIAGPTHFLESHQRIAGWRATLEAAGAPVATPLVGDWSAASGYELGRELLRSEDVTAVFVANDHMALGLLHGLHERGCGLPREVSVVGFDDVPEAAYFTPALSTVRQDFNELGRRAVHLILAEIALGASSPARVTVQPQLVLRGSTAPPSS
jgi:DNA-binding LacI/PurR family transcriptional regulator